MLIDLGAVTDAVTHRYRIPLLLASKSPPVGTQWEQRRLIQRDDDSLNTVRTLVEHGQNDPMQCDDIGFNSVICGAADASSKTLTWLLNQEQFAVDLWYKTPTGHTAAAYVTTRSRFSFDVLYGGPQ
jgi:hypothetical protein